MAFPVTLADEPMATHCRGTLLAASVRPLQRHGYFERYARAIASEHLETIMAGVAGWLPIEVGIAHYKACDSLGLGVDEQSAMGSEVVRELQRTFIGLTLKAASAGVGITPITGFQKFGSIYTRSIKGGGARALRVGPKDVRVEFVGLPLAAIPYFRGAYRGFLQAGCEFFARRVVIAELHAFRSDTTVAYRVAWA